MSGDRWLWFAVAIAAAAGSVAVIMGWEPQIRMVAVWALMAIFFIASLHLRASR